MSEPFIAEIRIFAGNFAPRSWAFCNGQLLPIAQNTALFSLVGTTYGGDGRTTFGLPNLQGRAVMHAGRGPGLTSRRLGETGGLETHTVTDQQMPSHSHSLAVSNEAATSSTPTETSTLGVTSTRRNVYGSAVDLEHMAATVGEGQSHNNRQPYIGLSYIIALQGLYPSRS